jgi:formate-dependent nitrite reductase membrane component NrfD
VSTPYLKQPVWKPEVGIYFFFGGLAGASAILGFGARLVGNARLARSALLSASLGAAVSPPLLIVDLGRPSRFLNMFRVLKPTSPMSVGSWVLGAFGGLAGAATVSELTGILRPLGRLAEAGAALLGLPLSTYTAVLVANTAVPVWHRARAILPFVFAAGAAASAGAAAAVLTPVREAGPARRLALLGAVGELAAVTVMESSLGDDAAPYNSGPAAAPAQAAKALIATGAAILGLGGTRRPLAVAGGSLILAGSLAERMAVLRAAKDSVLAAKP